MSRRHGRCKVGIDVGGTYIKTLGASGSVPAPISVSMAATSPNSAALRNRRSRSVDAGVVPNAVVVTSECASTVSMSAVMFIVRG